MNCTLCKQHIDLKINAIYCSESKVCICQDCVKHMHKVMEQNLKSLASLQDTEREETEENTDIILKPSEIKKRLDEYVIGQNDAKEMLAVAVYNHYKMLNSSNDNDDVKIEKSNILLIGPTGSGKTHLLKTLATIIDVPFAISDATSITEAGYVGEDAEMVVHKLFQAANYDKELTERGIVFIDEIDKISRKSESATLSRDVGGEGSQQALLKIIEGTQIPIKAKSGNCIIDTSKILFVCGGSFEGIEKFIEKRLLKGNTIGFGSSQQSKKEEVDTKNILSYATTDDIRKFGIIPELLGRLPILTTLNALDEEALISILVEPKNALFKQYQKLFYMDDIALEVTPDALKAIAKEALKRKTGARSLRTIMEKLLQKEMFSLPDQQEVKEYLIDEEVVLKKFNLSK